MKCVLFVKRFYSDQLAFCFLKLANNFAFVVASSCNGAISHYLISHLLVPADGISLFICAEVADVVGLIVVPTEAVSTVMESR